MLICGLSSRSSQARRIAPAMCQRNADVHGGATRHAPDLQAPAELSQALPHPLNADAERGASGTKQLCRGLHAHSIIPDDQVKTVADQLLLDRDAGCGRM